MIAAGCCGPRCPRCSEIQDALVPFTNARQKANLLLAETRRTLEAARRRGAATDEAVLVARGRINELLKGM